MPEQLEWTRREGIANIRLGDRPGSWHVPPKISSARQLLLRTHRAVVALGLFRLCVPGYRVFTANDLRHQAYPGVAGGEIYAVFEVNDDPDFAGREWNGNVLTDVLEAFEARKKHDRNDPWPDIAVSEGAEPP